MSILNQVILKGHVTRDSIVKEKPWGTKYAVMPLAVNNYYKDHNGNTATEVGFYDVYAHGDNFCQRVTSLGLKGQGVTVIGRLKQERWKTEGKNFTRTYIIAEHVEFDPPPGKKGDDQEESKNGQKKSKSPSKNKVTDLAEAAAGIRNELDEEFDGGNSEDFSEEEVVY